MSQASSSRRSRMASASNVMYTNAVYWPNYKIYQGHTPGTLDYGCINRVYYAFANVTAEGGVFLSDEWADATAPCDGVQGALGSLMDLKQKHPYLQVVLSIGGPNSTETYYTVAFNAILRDNFAQAARGLVEASGLDGIDIVWGYPFSLQQGSDFLALLAAIRIHLPEDCYLLTAALPAAKPVLETINLRQAAEYFDVVNLMAYDFFGSWSPKSGHHAQLYAMNKDELSGASGVQYLIASGVPSKKILLGIPLFGRSFLHVNGPGHKFRGAGGEEGSFEYSQLPRSGTKEQVDKRSVAAQCVGGDGGFITYDNPDTVDIKATFCKQKALGAFGHCTVLNHDIYGDVAQSSSATVSGSGSGKDWVWDETYQQHRRWRMNGSGIAAAAATRVWISRSSWAEGALLPVPGGGLHPIAEGIQPLPVPNVEPPHTTNAYEDEDGYEVIEQQSAYQPAPSTCE